MSVAAICPYTARILLRIRWLAWGAIFALMAMQLAPHLAGPSQTQTAPASDFVAGRMSVLG
ncbi:hypothetical protein [Aurantiacibacter flavus]|uniref:Uncharacterized protein n=1 Tax=Aurantiacibacter flavus TaxID=3145232 RepID=A0ABV0CTP9_9SPHN